MPDNPLATVHPITVPETDGIDVPDAPTLYVIVEPEPIEDEADEADEADSAEDEDDSAEG